MPNDPVSNATGAEGVAQLVKRAATAIISPGSRSSFAPGASVS
jgi:hypothetical protein